MTSSWAASSASAARRAASVNAAPPTARTRCRTSSLLSFTRPPLLYAVHSAAHTTRAQRQSVNERKIEGACRRRESSQTRECVVGVIAVTTRNEHRCAGLHVGTDTDVPARVCMSGMCPASAISHSSSRRSHTSLSTARHDTSCVDDDDALSRAVREPARPTHAASVDIIALYSDAEGVLGSAAQTHAHAQTSAPRHCRRRTQRGRQG